MHMNVVERALNLVSYMLCNEKNMKIVKEKHRFQIESDEERRNCLF